MIQPDPFVGRSEMAARMRAFDWTGTPLGPVDGWPQSLRAALSICIGSRFPIAIYWGRELVLLYNDAWSPIPGGKHPWALGRPAAEVWPEIWDAIGPLFDQVQTTGEATYLEDALLLMHRHGYTEECYFNYTFTPIRGETGETEGVFNAVVETTYRVVGERRTRLLQAMGERLAGMKSADQACVLAAEALVAGGTDTPFCLIYKTDAGESAQLVAAAGIPGGHPAGPATLSLDQGAPAPWPLPANGHTTQVEIVRDLHERFSTPLPGGRWPDPAREAMVVPIRTGLSERPFGFLVLGANPRRAVDDEYLQFATRAASQVATAVASAAAYEVERKRAESLAALDRAKTTFFSNVSHEFRTPLTLMLGPTEDALASGRSLGGNDLETVYRNELRLLKLVNALLDFSRLEAGRMPASFEATDLAQLTMDLASSFRSAFERAGLRFIVRCDAVKSPLYVDPEMWEKIVLNLLSNALKFTFEGEVEIRLSEEPGGVSLAVRDTGIGIAENEIARVFERFHRIEGARARTHEGSGIGLALVYDLVRLHGGTCQVASRIGTGTTVTVTIPAGSAHLPADHIVAAQAPAGGRGYNPFVAEALRWLPGRSEREYVSPRSDSDAGGPSELSAQIAEGHVLVADDNEDMRDYLTRLLRRHWSVEAVADGWAALEAARIRVPDLVLADVMMPGLDGFGLLQALRSDERTSAVPVVMLSARAGQEARIEGVQAGADDYLVKPFSARELMARVNAQLRLAHAARERSELLAREQEARREAELQKKHLHSLLMQAPTAIVVLKGPDYVIELANPYVCKVWGRRHEDVINLPLFDALPEIREQGWKELLDEVYASGRPYVGSEAPASLDRHGDGTLDTVFLNFVYTALRNAREETDGILVMAFDVTDQVLARRELSDLREQAEAANRAKDEFLAMLGHELRNPLAPILTALQLLKLRGDDTGERERVIIERQVKHLVSLVDDLLDVSRITRGKVELRRAPIEIGDIVARAIEMASPLLEQQSHALSVDVPGPGLAVDGDAGRLAQVFANLLTNAAKYTEPGGEISIAARLDGGAVVISVRDTGIGIDAEMLPRVFELFAQERQALDRSRGGLGLGLAIVRSLVAMHGGSVAVSSGGTGKGSEFTIRLPHAELPGDQRHAPDKARQPAGTENGARVLVVDDNEDGALLLAEMLSLLGYVARYVHDGPSALEVAEDFRPEIALFDIGLPVMDGYELARRFAEHPTLAGTQLLAVTGYGQDQDRERSADAGFRAHLVKPVDLDQLKMALDKVGPTNP